ncbi:hypothetical protein, partial [Salmonella enterica]|uniref:hypothetical protein n=1 Tax=Salmonella enterica TaxID=28901 RepID=UPI001BAFB111
MFLTLHKYSIKGMTSGSFKLSTIRLYPTGKGGGFSGTFVFVFDSLLGLSFSNKYNDSSSVKPASL